jgi:diguanylate cyclase (GGDEF)-like protein
MNYSFAINTTFGPCLLIMLIFADYLRKCKTDSFLRNLFFGLLGISLAAIFCNFVHLLVEGIPGRETRTVLIIASAGCFFFQVAAYYFAFALVDYLSYKDAARTRIIFRIILGITVFHVFLLALNIPLGYYFYISEDNRYHYGKQYFAGVILSYLPALFAIIEIFISPEKFKKYQFILVFLFLIFTSAGLILDVLFDTVSLIWPWLVSMYLYSYFFIITSDFRIDSLTGLGNRFSFNEFIEKLSKSTAQESWSIVMIDMDRFKEINDTLGHLEGDNALRDMAAIIKRSARHSDFAARYGGDEFVLAARAEFDILKLMERIQEAVDAQNEKNYRPYKLALSYGCGVYTTNSGRHINDFLKHIDELMYREKQRKSGGGAPGRGAIDKKYSGNI